jgi:hypothetical protein
VLPVRLSQRCNPFSWSCHLRRQAEVERDAECHREADRAQHRQSRRGKQAEHEHGREHADERGVQRAPLLGGIAGAAFEEQRVVQAEAGGERQRNQMEQRQRHTAGAQHGQHEQGRQRHRRDDMPGAADIAKRDRNGEREQHERREQRLADAFAIARDQRFRRALEIEQADTLAVAAERRRLRGDGSGIMNVAQRRPMPGLSMKAMSTECRGISPRVTVKVSGSV